MEIYCDCPECAAIRERWPDEELADEMAFMALLRDTLSAAGVGIDVDGEAMLMRPKPGRPSDETIQEWVRDNDAGRSCGWIAARDGYMTSTVEFHIRKARKEGGCG